jgi:homoserine kinase
VTRLGPWQGPVTVRPPATSANLGPGFDAFGLALELRDEVVVEVVDAGLDVRVEGQGAAEVPRDERHLVVRSLRAAFELMGVQPPGLRVSCRNAIPHGRGLGSSSAAICAGVTAARALVKDGADRLDDDDLLDLATRLEGHPDNVAPCFRGGFTIAWTEGAGADVLRLDPAPEVRPIVFVPAASLSTDTARALLPERVPHRDAAFNAGRSGLLVAALTGPGHRDRDRAALLRTATEDRLHQDYRAAAMPDGAELIARLRAAGFAAVVSGAGPSVLALATGADQSVRALEYTPEGWTCAVLAVAAAGVLTGDGADTP